MLGWVVVNAPAQVEMEVTLYQEQFLPGETLPAAVKITNRSGQELHLGVDTNWLTFNVESVDNFLVVKKAEVPVGLGPLTWSSRSGRSNMWIWPLILRWSRPAITGLWRRCGSKPRLERGGDQPPEVFDLINGILLGSQDFGVPVPAGSAGHKPEMRKIR